VASEWGAACPADSALPENILVRENTHVGSAQSAPCLFDGQLEVILSDDPEILQKVSMLNSILRSEGC